VRGLEASGQRGRFVALGEAEPLRIASGPIDTVERPRLELGIHEVQVSLHGIERGGELGLDGQTQGL
jgi:hypothetical protein